MDLNRIQEIVREEVCMVSAADDETKISHFLEYIESSGHTELKQLVMPVLRYYALSVYLLKYVSIVMIKLTDIKYAFDVFDALNTAGEPLTALESFRAQAFSRGPKGLSDDIKYRLDQISSCMADMKSGVKQGYTKMIIETLSYAMEGRCGSMANNKLQREFIRRSHDNCTDKDGYIFTLYAIFRLYWDFYYANNAKSRGSGNIKMKKIDFNAPIANIGHFPHKFSRIDQLCLQTLINANHRLALAPLSLVYDRYLRHNCDKDDFDEFTACLRTVTAFSTLFRLYMGGTARGIDKIYKDLMRLLHDDQNAAVTAALLREDLGALLHKMSDTSREVIDFLGSESSDAERSNGADSCWSKRVADNDCYHNVSHFTRLALLLLQDNTSITIPIHTSTDAQDEMSPPAMTVHSEANYRCSYHCEHSAEYDYSIEHLVPQDEKYFHILGEQVHQLGNLLLVPLKFNQSMGAGNLASKAERITAVQTYTDPEQAAITGLDALGEIYKFYRNAPTEEQTGDINDRYRRMIAARTKVTAGCVYTLLIDLFRGRPFRDT